MYAGRVHWPGEASQANWKGDTHMNAKLLIPLVAATFFSLSAHAYDCSGGPNGGMDATGNECNDTASLVTVATTAGATFASAHVTKGETNKAASCAKCVNKTTVETRHVAARQRSKHS